MSITGWLIAGFCGGFTLVGIVAGVCRMEWRQAQGKTTRRRIRRRKDWRRMRGPMPEDGSISYGDDITYWLLVSQIQRGVEAAEPQYKEGQL